MEATGAAASRAFALQQTLGADLTRHPGGTLLAHLRRVHSLTVAWAASRRTQLAAICHATYGTDGFDHPLLPITQRGRLRGLIGGEAETLVYVYGACHRAPTYPQLGRDPLEVRDRFTGNLITLHGADLADFAVLTIANELDVVRFAGLSKAILDQIRALIEALATYAPVEAAHALNDPALSRPDAHT